MAILLTPLLGAIHGYSKQAGLSYDWTPTAIFMSLVIPLHTFKALPIPMTAAHVKQIPGMFVAASFAQGTLLCAGMQIGKSAQPLHEHWFKERRP